MNTVTAYVTEVLSNPYYVDNENKYGEGHYNWWAVDVKYQDMGGSGEKSLTFDSKKEAEKVEKGYKFSH